MIFSPTPSIFAARQIYLIRCCSFLQHRYAIDCFETFHTVLKRLQPTVVSTIALFEELMLMQTWPSNASAGDQNVETARDASLGIMQYLLSFGLNNAT